jgi:hypothetical protein
VAVEVTRADLPGVVVVRQGSLTVASGRLRDGRRVTFAGEARPVGVLLAVVELDGSALAEVEPWQVLAVEEPEP